MSNNGKTSSARDIYPSFPKCVLYYRDKIENFGNPAIIDLSVGSKLVCSFTPILSKNRKKAISRKVVSLKCETVTITDKCYNPKCNKPL
jgi:hypothetical protein